MSHLVEDPSRPMAAPEISRLSRLPLPTVSKLLRILGRAGLLVSQRGAHGGYVLASAPEDISVARIVSALEGSTGLTLCADPEPSDCAYENLCPLRGHWRKISDAVNLTLESISLADLFAKPESLQPSLRTPLSQLSQGN